MIQKLTKEVFDYIYRIASLNEKYSDIVKIHNFTFFVESMKQLDLPFLDTFMTTASRERMESGEKYVKWMVSYEFEHLADLVTRMEVFIIITIHSNIIIIIIIKGCWLKSTRRGIRSLCSTKGCIKCSKGTRCIQGRERHQKHEEAAAKTLQRC